MISYRTKNGSKYSLFVYYLLGSILIGHEVVALKCYVCDLENQYLPNCDNFNSKNRNTFAKDCPQDLSGSCAIARMAGNVVSLTCEDRKLSDCKTANDIEYCFCTNNLCNSIEKYPPSNSDDEDFPEGSGTRVTTVVPGTLPNYEDRPSVRLENDAAGGVQNFTLLTVCFFIATTMWLT